MQKGDARGRPRAESEPRTATATPKKKVARDSSVGSGREVRCGCQYFQTDSLLPERVTLVGRPPSRSSLSRTSNMAATMGDHEYEPINPRPQPVETPAQKFADKEITDIVPKRAPSETSSRGSRERDFIIISLHEDSDVIDKPHLHDVAIGGEEEKQLTPQELQAHMEERYFAATPTTTESRTDCDVNTSQLDSSGLEDLPLRRGSRKKKQEEGDTPPRAGFQQRIRSQAGRIRAKLRSMKMPERPKFNLPDRPKFNMPERPKFNFPDRPKFSMPERPKFNLPERPKFNMPSMPTFSRNKSGTSSTRRPLRDRATNPSSESNVSSSRKNLFDFDFKTYPRIFDRSKRKGDYATSSPRSTPRSQTPPPYMESTKKPKMPSRKKGPVGSRWVHRFSDIKYVDDEENKPENQDLRYRRGDSPDVRVIRLRDSTDDEREERMEREEIEERERLEEMEDVIRRRERGYENEVRDAVEELAKKKQERNSGHTESTTTFHDKDYGYEAAKVEEKIQTKEESFPESDKEMRSSGSSSDRHRAGVLEEIDSDEFFLREKGISREDVDVERYLTNEIRDAFRAPVNALSKIDKKYYSDDDEEENTNIKYGEDEIEPVPPIRTRSLKPRKRTNKAPITPEEDTTNFFNTFPPARPKRNRRYQQEGNDDVSKDDEIIEEEDDPHATPSFLITHHSEVSYDDNDDYRNKMDDEQWQDEEPIVVAEPPTAPKRVRRSRVEQAPESSFKDQVPEALRNGHHTDDWSDEMDTRQVQHEVLALEIEPDYIIMPESPPVAPKRERRSRGTSLHSLAMADEDCKTSRGTSLHSLAMANEDHNASRGTSLHSLAMADEDRTSRGAESLRSERDSDRNDVMQRDRADERIGTVQLREADLAESGGYATVEKIYPTKPARPNRPKPPRPPAPARRKRLNHFFSLPRKNTHTPPTRPLRNYSTLGPSRPNRREKTLKKESLIEPDDDYSRSGHDEIHGSNRDLKSGEVIQKMKDRPLPAPPRPPRKGKDTQEETEYEVEEEIFDTIAEPVLGSALGALNDTVFYSQKDAGTPVTFPSAEPMETQISKEIQETCSGGDREAFLVPADISLETEFYEEVSVATQTDPLPEDFCMDMYEDEPPVMADACTETIELKPSIPHATDSRNDKAEMTDNTGTSSEEKTVVVEEVVKEIRVIPALQQEQSVSQTAMSVAEQSPVAVQPMPEQMPVTVQPTPVANQLTSEAVQPTPVAVQPPVTPLPPTIIERQVPVYILPDQDTVVELKAQRLHVSDLDVSRLNVGELSAQKILVSDIDSASLQVTELSSKSGRLVVNGLELPPGFLQELYDSFPRPSVPTPQPEATTLPTEPISPIASPPVLTQQEPAPPSVPPLPMNIPMEPMYSFIPSAIRASHSQPHDMESEEEVISFVPTSSPRRRRHHVSKPMARYSTDEEEEIVSFHPRRQTTRGETSSDPTVTELSRQLISAVHSSTIGAMRTMLQYTANQLEGEDKRRELQTAICILLVLVAGLILMGFGTGKPQHHHHWDYFNPPNN